jgi:hypothetical protein
MSSVYPYLVIQANGNRKVGMKKLVSAHRLIATPSIS